MIVFLVTIVLGVSGCMGNQNTNVNGNRAERLKEEALSYLNGLYDDSFRPVTFEGKSWAYNYDTLLFSSENYDGGTFHVYHGISG
jgi:hypothetical protein